MIAYLGSQKQEYEEFQKVLSSIDSQWETVRCQDMLELLSYVTENQVEQIFISPTKGLDLGKLISILRHINGKSRIVLVSDNKADAYDAMEEDLDGFLLKPVERSNLQHLMDRLAKRQSQLESRAGPMKKIRMCTMPRFDMFVDGVPLLFSRRKSKELMAFLVNADGGMVNVSMILQALWPGEPVTPALRNNCRVLVNALKTYLLEMGLDGLFVGKNGQYRLNKEAYTSDVDDLLNGDKKTILQYDQRYMEEYGWAAGRQAVLNRWALAANSS